jgi:hypothetical protein
MFGKDADGNIKDEQWARIANLAAERGEMVFYAYLDRGDGWNPLPVELKVRVNADTGVATLSGALDGNSLNGTAVLSPEADPDIAGASAVFARFFTSKYVIEVKFPLETGPTMATLVIGDPSGKIVNR